MKTGKKPCDSKCKTLRIEMVSKDVGARKNGARM
jgi:hypothetical protein